MHANAPISAVPAEYDMQRGRQPGTFSHVTLVDLGGSMKFKAESSHP